MLAQLNDCIGSLLHLGPNVITFWALLHLGPNVFTFIRTLLHLGQLLHLGLQQLQGKLHRVAASSNCYRTATCKRSSFHTKLSVRFHPYRL